MIVLVIFGWGFVVFLDINTAPADAYEVQVTGQKWKWLFTYPNGHVDENLHVPVDQSIRLVMTSEDVIHSFFVPAFNFKRDAIPGVLNTFDLSIPQAGLFRGECAELCGVDHSDMTFFIRAVPAARFDAWLRVHEDDGVIQDGGP